MGEEALLRELEAQPKAIGRALRPSAAVSGLFGRCANASGAYKQALGPTVGGRVFASAGAETLYHDNRMITHDITHIAMARDCRSMKSEKAVHIFVTMYPPT